MMHGPTIQPVFKLELNHKVVPNIVTVGRYDGTHVCLTAAAGYDKVIIHATHAGAFGAARAQRSAAHSEVSELNVSQAVTALAAGPLRPAVPRDMLLIGSPSQILAYDVHDNSDLFCKEAPDGVRVLVVGRVGAREETVALVGGNSSVLALDHEGTELFWSVVGGSVCSIILFDFDKDGENELIIGCSDSFIRILKNSQVIMELAETGSVLHLAPISDVRFAYAVANGTIGVYEEATRLWRVKSKQNAAMVQWSGTALAVCWSNGRVDWRDVASGNVLRRVQLRSDAAAMLLADYRSVGVCDLLCISQRGEVVGYPPYQESAEETKLDSGAKKKPPSEEELNAITELFNKKQALMVELQHYEANAASTSSVDLDRPSEAMPVNTKLQVSLAADEKEVDLSSDMCPVAYVPTTPRTHSQRCIELWIATNTNMIVRAAILLAEGIFPDGGEMLARHPPRSQLQSHLRITLQPPRDVPVDIHVKAFIGYPDSEQFHIFELTKQLPRFSMYTLVPHTLQNSADAGHVTFKITERVQRICIWINQNFLLESEIEAESDDTKELHLNMLNLRSETPLTMDFEPDGLVRFSTPDIGLAGDLVQSLANYLNLSDLQSTASFPAAEQSLRSEMARAAGLGETRARLAADTAERAQLLTALLPAAHHASATYQLKEVLGRYHEVEALNEKLVASGHARRANQQEEVSSRVRGLCTRLGCDRKEMLGRYHEVVALNEELVARGQARRANQQEEVSSRVRGLCTRLGCNRKEMLGRYQEVVALNEELMASGHARRANQQEVSSRVRVLCTRLGCDRKEMLGRYHEVVALNEELVASGHARRANQQEAASALQRLHRTLQQTARLRVGKYSRAVVLASRKAVREDNIEGLIKILNIGDS